jgi:flagellar protein FliO/FliZ
MNARTSCPRTTAVAAALAAAPRHARRILVALLLTPALSLAAAGESHAPAAPFATPGDGMPLLRVLFALLLVLGAVFAAAKLSRRMGVAGGAKTPRLDIVAQATLGPRERAVLLRVGGREVLLGVATGNVRLLLELQGQADPAGSAIVPTAPTTDAPQAGPDRPSFRDLLLRSLGR